MQACCTTQIPYDLEGLMNVEDPMLGLLLPPDFLRNNRYILRFHDHENNQHGTYVRPLVGVLGHSDQLVDIRVASATTGTTSRDRPPTPALDTPMAVVSPPPPPSVWPCMVLQCWWTATA